MRTETLLRGLQISNKDSSGLILEKIIKKNNGFINSLKNIKGIQNKILLIKKQIVRSFWYSNKPHLFALSFPIKFTLKFLQKTKYEIYLKFSAKKVYIYRDIGGIGDLVMTLPTIHSLLNNYKKLQIDLYIPKEYNPIFKNIERVKLFNFTDFDKSKYKVGWELCNPCPAGFYESSHLPKVNLSRREIFAKHVGIKVKKYRPNINLTKNQLHRAKSILTKNNINLRKKILAVQMHAADQYKDYPQMTKLVEAIVIKYPMLQVVLLGLKKITVRSHPQIFHLNNLQLSELIGIISLSNIVITPDTSAVHIAACFSIPTIALFGPTDHKQILKHYPSTVAITSEYDCIPCWRNPNIPCKISNKDQSICMKKIKNLDVISEINKLI